MKFGLNRLKGRVAKIKCFCCLVLEKGITLYFRMVLNSDPPAQVTDVYHCIFIVELSLEMPITDGYNQIIFSINKTFKY